MDVSFISLLLVVSITIGISRLEAQNVYSSPRSTTTEMIGDVLLIVLPITTLTTSLYLGDKKETWQFTRSLLFTTIVTYGLKLSINKPRPDMSNNNSFPSGHSSTVFHSAGFIHRHYGFKYSVPAYVLAGLTAASRIDAEKHDILDVVAGAVIGLASNLIFTKANQQKQMEVSYGSANGNFMIGFKYKF